MDNGGRLLLRFILVPLGCAAAALAAAGVVFVASWRRFGVLFGNGVDERSAELVGAFVEDQFMLFLALGSTLTPMLVGVLISEAFAVRSCIFHVLSGVVSCWSGWHLFGGVGRTSIDPLVVIAAGIAAGFAYWAVAGFSAGFWKPVFHRDPPPQVPATGR